MKYIKQFGIILAVTFAGEVLKYMIPLPVPASIYGLLLLTFRLVKLEQVKEAGLFLIEIMPLMFIPAAAGLVTSWTQIKGILASLCVMIPLNTCFVMIAAGKVTDYLIERRKKGHE